MRRLTCLDLFSGIGGASIAAEAAGFQVIGHAEIDPFCCQILHQHWPKTTNYGNVDRTESFDELRGAVDVIWASIPCQPHSVAGRRLGSKDDRDKWPATRAIIERVKPRWVLIENPPGIISSGAGQDDEDPFAESSVGMLETILDDLGKEGFVTQVFNVPANAVGALHLRYRIFVVAFSAQGGHVRRRDGRGEETGSRASVEFAGTGNDSEPLADAGSEAGQERIGSKPDEPGELWWRRPGNAGGEALADAARSGRDRRGESDTARSECDRRTIEPERCSETIPYADSAGRGEQLRPEPTGKELSSTKCVLRDGDRDFGGEGNGESFAGIRKLVDGVSSSMDRIEGDEVIPSFDGPMPNPLVPGRTVKNRSARIKALGNSVCPAQCLPLFQAIADVENG